MNMTKVAFIRYGAKWLGEGEKNSCFFFFFAMEKGHYKRNNVTSLKIQTAINCNPSDVVNHTVHFYPCLYACMLPTVAEYEKCISV